MDKNLPVGAGSRALSCYSLRAMSGSNGPDLYRRSLARAKDTWNEHKGHPMVFSPPVRKERVFSRSDKRRARQEARTEITRSF